ncbi:hypothetical protein [Methylotuvimicrobium alcaliphilum]|uniref:Uncharacterized protein n=1 Tax=Methylotuvimicrobium alcaliphilum (strain DSM 19304 / NCIMB 14124 / VKM B-2133 / 20Z) TaxID=1091494 RepID=G4STS8_META2|nr:hypothetical protein [Methylotuvimicrobium alcaliphilum]CCE21750.1 protein of unknown function [Methylotuvimicrobium alcaliphilum 20Z]
MKTIVVAFLVLTGLEVPASECSNIQYLDAKSQGIEVVNDRCAKGNEVGLGTVFKLSPDARLWIKSLPKPETDADFQLVCQNGSSAPLEVTVSSLFLPWITPTDLKNCTGWVDHKLKCDGVHGGSNAFFCAIAAIKRSETAGSGQLAMSTSVKMRNYSDHERQAGIDEIFEAIEPEVGLCRNLFQVDGKITVHWTVDSMGRAESVMLSSIESEDGRFSNCVEAVIKDYRYPATRTGQKFTRTF